MDDSSPGTSTREQTPAGASVDDAVLRRLAVMLQREPGSIDLDMRFFEDLGFDSTSILEVLMYLEDDLDIEFDQDAPDPADLETVGTLIDYARKQLG